MKDVKTPIILPLVVLILSSVFYGCAFSSENQKIEKNRPTAYPVNKSSSGAAVLPVKLFQKYISRVDGNRCPMHPSCSSYAVEAIKKHGFIKGWIMTSDRLMRCGRDEVKHAGRIWINGRNRSYDPIENNDFWWRQSTITSGIDGPQSRIR